MAKFKLNYNPTYTFNLGDIFDASVNANAVDAEDSDIVFESKARLEPEWAQLNQKWMKEDEPPIKLSLEIVGMGITKVSQNGSELVIANSEGALELMNAIEEGAPGQGEIFIEHLVIGHWNLHFLRMGERKKKLAPSSEKLPNGKSRAKAST